jgi:hypothetical protein
VYEKLERERKLMGGGTNTGDTVTNSGICFCSLLPREEKNARKKNGNFLDFSPADRMLSGTFEH